MNNVIELLYKRGNKPGTIWGYLTEKRMRQRISKKDFVSVPIPDKWRKNEAGNN